MTLPAGAPMKNVNRVKGRDGVERLYFRKAGEPPVRLKSAWGSPELEAEVETLRGGAKPKPLPGTLKLAIRAYELESADFKGLAESTKADYRLKMYEIDEDFGHLPIATFRAPFILSLRDLWAARGYQAANHRLQVLRNVLLPHIIAGRIDGGDPFALIEGVRRPHDMQEPHPVWPERILRLAVERAIAKKAYGLARGIVIGRYAGARRDDIVKLTPDNRHGGRFRYLASKKKVPVDMPEDPELTRWLARIPGQQPNEGRRGRKLAKGVVPLPTRRLVFNLQGQPYTGNGFYQAVKDLIAELQKAGLLNDEGFDVHGLRHTFGVEAALAGCSDAQGAALLGHKSPHSFAKYRRQAERIALADDGAAKIAALRERAANAANPELQNNLQKNCKTPDVAP